MGINVAFGGQRNDWLMVFNVEYWGLRMIVVFEQGISPFRFSNGEIMDGFFVGLVKVPRSSDQSKPRYIQWMTYYPVI